MDCYWGVKKIFHAPIADILLLLEETFDKFAGQLIDRNEHIVACSVEYSLGFRPFCDIPVKFKAGRDRAGKFIYIWKAENVTRFTRGR